MDTRFLHYLRMGLLCALFFLTLQNGYGQTQIEDPCYSNYPSLSLIGTTTVCQEEVWIYLKYSDLVNFNPGDGNLLIDWDSSDLDNFNYNGPAAEHFAYIGDGVGSVISIRIPDANPGTYTGTITLTNASGCSNIPLPFSATIKEPLPKPTIEVTSGSTVICEEGSATFKATGAVGAVYRWYRSGVQVFKGQEYNTGNLGTPGNNVTYYYTYEVSQSYSDEIGNPLCESETASITITHSGLPYGGNIYANDKMCTGTTKSVTWYNMPTPGGTYLSSNTDVATVDESGLVTGISVGTANISYVLKGQGACSGITVTSIEQFEVIENYAEITGNNSPVCVGDEAKFYINVPPGKILNYRVNGGETVSVGTNQIIADGALTFAGGFTESLTLTLVSVEYNPYCTKDLDQSSTVFANPVPITTVSPTTFEIAEGSPVPLKASGAVSYSWISEPAGFTATGSEVTVYPTVNTTYRVTGTTNGCSSEASSVIYVQQKCTGQNDQYEPNNSMDNAGFVVPVGIKIAANLLNSKDVDWYGLYIDENAKYTLLLQNPNGTNLPTAALYNAAGRSLKSIDRANPNSYNLSTGWYYIKVSAKGLKSYLCYTLQVLNIGPAIGPLASALEDELKSAGIELTEDGNCFVWPNPAREEFSLYNGFKSPVRVRVSDMLGRTMETIENVGPEKTIVFGADYKPGIYIVETSGEDVRQVFKVIKQQ